MAGIWSQGLRGSRVCRRTVSWLYGGNFVWKLKSILVKGGAWHEPHHLQSWSLDRGEHLSLSMRYRKVVPHFQRRLSWVCPSAVECLPSMWETVGSVSSRTKMEAPSPYIPADLKTTYSVACVHRRDWNESSWGVGEAAGQYKNFLPSFWEVIGDTWMSMWTLPEKRLLVFITMFSLRCEDTGNWKVWETKVNRAHLTIIKRQKAKCRGGPEICRRPCASTLSCSDWMS